MTAIEQDDLDIRQPKTLADVFMGVPRARIAGASARMLGQALNIRGIGNTEQFASEGRIDVLRGPASSRLFGSGVIGRVIALTTRDGSDYRAKGESTALKFRVGCATNGDTWKTCVTWAHRMGNAEFLASIHRSRGGVMHDLSESLPVFGTLASTRRMPTLDDLYSYRPQVASLTLRKEAARTGELGLAWALQQGALEGLGVNLTVEDVFDADYRNNLTLDKAPGMNVKLAIGKSLRWRGWHSFCWSSWPRRSWPRGPRRGDLDAAERLPDHHPVRPWRQVFPRYFLHNTYYPLIRYGRKPDLRILARSECCPAFLTRRVGGNGCHLPARCAVRAHQLTFPHERNRVMPEETEVSRGLPDKQGDTSAWPDGRFAVRWKGSSLPCQIFDADQPRMTHAEPTENKRLSETWDFDRQIRDARLSEAVKVAKPEIRCTPNRPRATRSREPGRGAHHPRSCPSSWCNFPGGLRA